MTNEEKAREIEGFFESPNPKDVNFLMCYQSALKMAEWKDKQMSEDVSLIVDWFNHIAQIADDRKTLNGFVMQDSDALDEIKCLAKRSAEYVDKFLKKIVYDK